MYEIIKWLWLHFLGTYNIFVEVLDINIFVLRYAEDVFFFVFILFLIIFDVLELAIDDAIAARVNATPPEQLEASIQGIVKNELQAIVNIGGVLGVVVGLVQAAFLYIQQSL